MGLNILMKREQACRLTRTVVDGDANVNGHDSGLQDAAALFFAPFFVAAIHGGEVLIPML